MQSSFSPSQASALNLNNQPAPAATDKAAARNYEWILHPAIDLFFVCGGLIWLFGCLMASGLVPKAANSPFMTTVAITALIVFSMPHQTATYLRVYNSERTRKKLGKLVGIFGAVCIFLGMLVMVSPLWASIIGRITLGFSLQHFYAQAYGIALLYCYKRGFFLSKLEKNTLHTLVYAGIWAAVFNVFTNPNLNVAGFKLLTVASVPVAVRSFFDWSVLVLAGAFIALMVRKWLKSKKVFPWPAILTLISCFLFLDYLSRTPSFIYMAILGQSLFHSPQYLVVTTAYHIKEVGLPENVPNNKIWKQLFKPVGLQYLAFVLGAGWILSTVIGPNLPKVGIWMGFNAELAFCAYYCAINLHHYIADGLIWKMRDKDTLQTLVA